MSFTEENRKVSGKGKFLLFTGIGILAFLFASLIISRLVYPFDNGILEAYNWLPARLITEGSNPYAFALTPPYNMSPYGVVFYVLLAAGLKLFGFQFWFGRMLSVLAFAVCLWAIAGIVQRLESRKEAVWVSILAGLAMYPAQFWISSMRPDLIGAAFVLCALRLCLSIEKNEKISLLRLTLIVLLAGLAFFTKQTFLLPAGIIFLRFLQLDKKREAVGFAAAFAVLTAAGIWFLDYTSAGGYLWQHFTHARRLPFSWHGSILMLETMLKMSVFSVFIVFLLIFIYRKRELVFAPARNKIIDLLRSPKTLLLFYFLLATLWAFVSSGRVGANVNYYFESSFAAAIICGFIYEDFCRHRASQKFGLALIVLLTLGGSFQLTRVLRGEYYRWSSLSFYREISDTVAKNTVPGDLCVSVNIELGIFNGCNVNFGDFEEYYNGWSPELREIFEREIKQGRYAVIIWYDDKLQAEFPDYRLVQTTQNSTGRYFPVYLYLRNQLSEQQK